MIDGKLRQLRKFILVDEADNFLKLGFSSIRKILKEGREFGVGTILSTQFLKHFDTQQDDFSKYILSWIVHKVDDLSPKDVKNLFNTCLLYTSITVTSLFVTSRINAPSLKEITIPSPISSCSESEITKSSLRSLPVSYTHLSELFYEANLI